MRVRWRKEHKEPTKKPGISERRITGRIRKYKEISGKIRKYQEILSFSNGLVTFSFKIKEYLKNWLFTELSKEVLPKFTSLNHVHFLLPTFQLSLKHFKVLWQNLQIQDLRLQSFGRLIGTIKKVLSHKWSAGRKLRNWKMQLFEKNVSSQMDLRHYFIFNPNKMVTQNWSHQSDHLRATRYINLYNTISYNTMWIEDWGHAIPCNAPICTI